MKKCLSIRSFFNINYIDPDLPDIDFTVFKFFDSSANVIEYALKNVDRL